MPQVADTIARLAALPIRPDTDGPLRGIAAPLRDDPSERPIRLARADQFQPLCVHPLLAGRLLLRPRDRPVPRYPALSQRSAGAPGRARVGLYLALIALLTSGRRVLRDAAAAIGAVLGLLYLFPISPLPPATAPCPGTWSRPAR